MPVISYIGIGSNIGDRKSNCLRAIELARQAGTVTRISSFYSTEPVGYKEQDYFINAVAELETELPPRELLRRCLSIEEQMGRTRTLHWGPRIIDLDILLYGDQAIAAPDLVIPHPLMATRKFVLVPLDEIAPDAVHPLLKKNVRQLLRELNDPSTVVKM